MNKTIKKKLELMEIDIDAVAINCDKFGYAYAIVTKDDLILPPIPHDNPG